MNEGRNKGMMDPEERNEGVSVLLSLFVSGRNAWEECKRPA